MNWLQVVLGLLGVCSIFTLLKIYDSVYIFIDFRK